jgi:hypothetical protein
MIKKIEGSGEEYITAENKNEHIREKNMLQFDLLRRKFGESDTKMPSSPEATLWVEEYSESFNLIWEREIRANSNLLSMINEPSTRETILEDFESELYGQKGTDRVVRYYEVKFDDADEDFKKAA